MSKNKKKFNEQLQEVREHHMQKRRFLLRKQEDADAQRRLDDYLKNAMKHDDEDFGTDS